MYNIDRVSMNKKEKITKTLENFSGGRELLEKFHKKDLILWNWKWYFT